MQIQNFLVTERTDDPSRTGARLLFLPSMYSNWFCPSFFPLNMLSYLKNFLMKLKHMKISARFAKGLVF